MNVFVSLQSRVMKTNLALARHAIVLLLLSTINFQLSTALAQGTAFTYQGRLNDGAAPASGSYDFRFRVASDPFANDYAAPAILTNSVPVANGLFAVTLDFGGGVFTGGGRWLEIALRTNGAGAYSTLSPLQPLTTAPMRSSLTAPAICSARCRPISSVERSHPRNSLARI